MNIFNIESRLENIFKNINKEQKDVGELWRLDGTNTVVYIAGRSQQGFIYKDEAAYENSLNEICYISEYGFTDYDNQLNEALTEYENGNCTIVALCEYLQEIEVKYTHQDILDLCNGQEEVSAVVFETVDWQFPETYLSEMYRTFELDEFEGILVLTEGLSLKKHLYELYKNDWCNYRNITEIIDEEIGINGECYVSFDEFKKYELQNIDYMKDLIKKNQQPTEYKIEKYQKALDYYNNIHGSDLGEIEQKEKLIYCYEHKKDLIDFDFWVQYANLLGEDISYSEYVSIDRNFDDDPFDYEPFNVEIIQELKQYLNNYRESIKLQEYAKDIETNCGKGYTLNERESIVLDKIANSSGMDCWFSISEDQAYIFDLEKGVNIPLKMGINDLNEGITDVENYGLSKEEIEIYNNLLKELEINSIDLESNVDDLDM